MPYISEHDRNTSRFPINPGKLNYIIYTECLNYILDVGECYQSYNDVLGVLSAVDNEIKHRLLNSYEDRKIKENGDIEEKLQIISNRYQNECDKNV